ncbi:MAG: DUF2894 domain-containing protein [Luteibacter sp.]
MRPDTSDVIRRHVIDALEKRASEYEGEAREVIDEKLARLRAAGVVTPAAKAVSPAPSQMASLAALTEHMVSAAALREKGRRSSYPELATLDYFQAVWSGLRTESQWRQTLVDAPENAGPLNSSALVHRAIALMRDMSPGYLQHFLAYVDDLSWLDRLSDGGSAAAKEAPRPATIGKRVRKKAVPVTNAP